MVEKKQGRATIISKSTLVTRQKKGHTITFLVSFPSGKVTKKLEIHVICDVKYSFTDHLQKH